MKNFYDVLNAVSGAFGLPPMGESYKYSDSEVTDLTAALLRNGNVVVENYAGTCTVSVGDVESACISAKISYRSNSEEILRQAVHSVAVQVVTNGDGLEIGLYDIPAGRKLSESESDFLSEVDISADLSIILPQDLLEIYPERPVLLNISNSTGNIKVRDFMGAVELRVQTGNITLENMDISGDSSVMCGLGNISADISSMIDSVVKLTVETGNVSVDPGDPESSELQIRVGTGNISLDSGKLIFSEISKDIGYAGGSAVLEYDGMLKVSMSTDTGKLNY
ncbi:MAG: hypothetical protein IJ874_03135 [Ruminococcus sp.]|nr:hypothetical protein [Ruminococcus sp.]